MSARETALAALFDRIKGCATSAERNLVLPERVPAGGLLIQHDGDAGDPEVTLSPPSYAWEHQVKVELIVQVAPSAAPAALDVLLSALGAALDADPRLAGAVEWVDVGGPSFTSLPITGASPLHGATVPVILHYTTSSALG